MSSINASEGDVETFVKQEIVERAMKVNAEIGEPVEELRTESLEQSAGHLIEAGGKRLRPVLSLLVAESMANEMGVIDVGDYESLPDGEGNSVNVMDAALSVEYLHTFSLIHDDIMDRDDLRRGVPAVHREFNEEMAILSGDALFSKSFEMIHSTGASPEAIAKASKMLSETATELCEGQSLDISFETRSDVTPEEYLEMVQGKTGVLFGASMALPAILLGAEEERVSALYDYGVKIGKGFQIQDDVLDLTTPSSELGKQRGSDLVEEKKTLIALHAIQNGVELAGLVDADDVDSVTEEEIEEAVEALHQSGSIEYARTVANELVSEAEVALQTLPENEPRHILSSVATFLIERTH